MDGEEPKTNRPFSGETVFIPINMALTAASSLEERGSMVHTTGEPVPLDHAAGWPPLNLRLNLGWRRSEGGRIYNPQQDAV